MYSALCTELASHGYIVIAPQFAEQATSILAEELAQDNFEIEVSKIKVWAQRGVQLPPRLAAARVVALHCLGAYILASQRTGREPWMCPC